MDRHLITIQLTGAPEDNEHVRLGALIDQLDAFSAALKETERTFFGVDKSQVYFRVVNLSHSSPAAITLEAVSEDPDLGSTYADSVVRRFAVNLRVIRERQRRPKRADVHMLESYNQLGVTETNLLSGAAIITSGQKTRHEVALDQEFRNTMEQILGPDEIAHGSISGRLEALNLHNRNRFALYPMIGPQKVIGTFPQKLRGAFKAAMDRYVTLSGRLKFKAWDNFPYFVKADSIEVHPPTEEVERLWALRGMAPNITGGLSSQEFQRQVRDATNW